MTRSPRRSGVDVGTLAGVFARLLAAGATVIVMGPGGGPEGGHIVAAGPPEHVARDPGRGTGPWLNEHMAVLAGTLAQSHGSVKRPVQRRLPPPMPFSSGSMSFGMVSVAAATFSRRCETVAVPGMSRMFGER